MTTQHEHQIRWAYQTGHSGIEICRAFALRFQNLSIFQGATDKGMAWEHGHTEHGAAGIVKVIIAFHRSRDTEEQVLYHRMEHTSCCRRTWKLLLLGGLA